MNLCELYDATFEDFEKILIIEDIMYADIVDKQVSKLEEIKNNSKNFEKMPTKSKGIKHGRR